MTKLPPGIVIPSEDEFRRVTIALDAIKDIADHYGVGLTHQPGETLQAFARRVIKALADKFIDIDNAIERIEAVVPDVAQDI